MPNRMSKETRTIQSAAGARHVFFLRRGGVVVTLETKKLLERKVVGLYKGKKQYCTEKNTFHWDTDLLKYYRGVRSAWGRFETRATDGIGH